MPQAIYDYHYGIEAEQYAYFRIPKLLMTEPHFKDISTDAKLLYGLMLDRMGLSVKNGWLDDNERVYIYFTVEDVCDQLCCKKDKALKLFTELDTDKGIGLIERIRQGHSTMKGGTPKMNRQRSRSVWRLTGIPPPCGRSAGN